MTKIAQLPSFTPDQLDELRGIFSRFELILSIFRDFQRGLDDIDLPFGVPFFSVLRLFSESWHQNCLLFNRFLSASDFHLEEICCQIQSAADIFISSETACSSGLMKYSPGSASYAFVLQCVFLHCRALLADARRKLKKTGVCV